jgi:hypothetical protein
MMDDDDDGYDDEDSDDEVSSGSSDDDKDKQDIRIRYFVTVDSPVQTHNNNRQTDDCDNDDRDNSRDGRH